MLQFTTTMSPNSNKPADLRGTDAYLRALREPGKTDLRARYRHAPLRLADKMGLLLPKKPVQVMEELGIYDASQHGPITPGLRDLILDVCTLRVQDAAVVGPRGGGKSKGVSFIEFFLTFIHDFDALNLGGSELQADQVYSYLTEYIHSDIQWENLVEGETLQSKTTTKMGAWIRVLTASQKSVRSPHAGGWKAKYKRWAGGILVIDEEAEADPAIVNAALPTVNTARPSVNVRSSTFHNNVGSFADLMDNYAEMGYTKYSWDIFDVCERCDCRNECESPEPCFREDHVEQYVNPDTGKMEERLLHKAYCGGKARYAAGWIPMIEIVKMWRRMKRNHSRWEVEAMGSRPTTSGYVIKSRKDYEANITDKSCASLYMPGSPITICVDWGTVAAGVCVWQEQFGGKHVVLAAELLEEAGESEILGVILEFARRYKLELREIAADIGGGGNYLNKKLRDEMGYQVRDVNFQTEKEAAAAAWNIFNEAGLITYPSELTDLHEQIKRWRRKNGLIMKGNDHLCDSSVCYFARFIDELGVSKARIVGRSINTRSEKTEDKVVKSIQKLAQRPRIRVGGPRIRSIGRRGRRNRYGFRGR